MDRFYTSELSPFAARVRIAAALAGVPMPQIIAPPDGAGSAAMKAIAPFGQVPALRVGGVVLIESLALMEYVVKCAPSATLLPGDPVARARVRGVALAHDNHVFAEMRPLLMQLRAAAMDAAAFDAAFATLAQKLGALVGLFDESGFAVGGTLSLADVAIAPFTSLCDLLARRFDRPSPYALVARAASWWEEAAAVPAIAADTDRRRIEFGRLFGS